MSQATAAGKARATAVAETVGGEAMAVWEARVAAREVAVRAAGGAAATEASAARAAGRTRRKGGTRCRCMSGHCTRRRTMEDGCKSRSQCTRDVRRPTLSTSQRRARQEARRQQHHHYCPDEQDLPSRPVRRPCASPAVCCGPTFARTRASGPTGARVVRVTKWFSLL